MLTALVAETVGFYLLAEREHGLRAFNTVPRLHTVLR